MLINLSRKGSPLPYRLSSLTLSLIFEVPIVDWQMMFPELFALIELIGV